jgi:hypothetical protein
MLVLEARQAPGQGSQCTYANQYFNSGSTSCQNGTQYRCVAGRWEANGLACADTGVDEGQPELNVDPSRSDPSVRQPGVGESGVRQPAPPVDPQR